MAVHPRFRDAGRGMLAVEVHAADRAHPPNDEDEVRLEAEPIEPYRMIDALIDQVDVHSDANSITVRMVQKLDEG